jgi:hypothetical protein
MAARRKSDQEGPHAMLSKHVECEKSYVWHTDVPPHVLSPLVHGSEQN